VFSIALKLKDSPLQPDDAEAFSMAMSQIQRTLRMAADALQAVDSDLTLYEAIGQLQMVDDVLTGVQLGQVDGACLPELVATVNQAAASLKSFAATGHSATAGSSSPTVLDPQTIVHQLMERLKWAK